MNNAEELKQYKELLDQGTITQEEFDQKKAELLSRGNAPQQSGNTYVAKEKSMNKHVFTWVGCFLFGSLGVDRFMRGQVGLGILKLITVGGAGVWALIDWIVSLTKVYGEAFKDSENVTFINGKYGR